MKRFFALSLLLLAACSPSTKAPSVSNEEALTEIRLQKHLAVQERMKQIERLYRIGMPILAANAPLCGKKVRPYHGLMLESLASVPESYKDAMQIYYGLQNQLTVAYVVEGSPSYGKLERGDAIVKANGKRIRSGSKGLQDFYKAFWEDGRDVTLPIVLTVERGRKGTRQDVTIHPTASCASFLAFENDEEINARADGVNIIFTSGMMRFAADDDELAGIIGHELAHNARLHNEYGRVNEFLGRMLALVVESGTGMDFSDVLADLGTDAFSQSFETEADYVGLYMLARAGYDIDNAINVQRRFAVNNPNSIHLAGSSHPSSALRFLSMKKTVAEIREKQAKGLPLLPEEKTGADIMRDLENIN